MVQTDLVIRVQGFRKRYGRREAAQGIDLTVQRGEIYGLIGPDGAGKSSLMKAIAGVLTFDGGRVEVFGASLDSERAAESIKDRLGFMPQGLGLNLYPELSIEENVDFFARLRLTPDAEIAKRKARLLAMTRLEPFRDRAVKHLSGGMKQKLGLVCTLIHEPELIILDEPTTGVDPVSRRDFWGILAELLQQRQVTALVSTAYMDEAARFHHVSLLYAGRVLAQGRPDELQEGGERSLEEVFVSKIAARGETVPSAPKAPAMEPRSEGIAVEANGLVRRFGNFVAADAVSFQIRSGEIFGLLGANGAGKTTVIKMLTGILPPSEGFGRVAGADMRTAGRAIKERIGYMSQAFSLYQDLTVSENIRLYGGIYGLSSRESKERMRWIVGMAGLEGREYDLAASLPMGLRQRLALGCALVHKPQILFLDEPTSGVDPIGRRHFWNILFHLAREDGVAILVTTHYMSEAENCDHLALMHSGRIIADASPGALKAIVEAEAGRVLEITPDQPTIALGEVVNAGYTGAALYGNSVHVLTRGLNRDRERISALLESHGLHVIRTAELPLSMEDVFVYRITALEQQERAARAA